MSKKICKDGKEIMKAMILAAGLGTRLLPLTEGRPKALIEINGLPLIEILLRKLEKSGFSQVIINMHHHADQIRKYILDHPHPGMEIKFSDETDELLETGGGILKAAWFLEGNEPFLVHNVDIISRIDFSEIMHYHNRQKSLVTIAVSKRDTFRYLLFDKDNRLQGWKNMNTGEVKPAGLDSSNLIPLAFSGIHVIEPAIFPLLTEKGRFSIIDAYIRLAGSWPISGFIHEGTGWFDLGKKEQLAVANKFLAEHNEDF